MSKKIKKFIPRDQPYDGEISENLFKQTLGKNKNYKLNNFFYKSEVLSDGVTKTSLKGELIIEEKTEVKIKEEQNMLQKIYKELVELRNNFNDFKVEVNARFDRLESCPTIKKELVGIDSNDDDDNKK